LFASFIFQKFLIRPKGPSTTWSDQKYQFRFVKELLKIILQALLLLNNFQNTKKGPKHSQNYFWQH